MNRKLMSKEVRDMFLKYFIKDNNHTYVHSSPVFLNNDPSLLFVNAGMNQFKSLLLNKTQPNHPFHHLKRVANSQKCIRLSGKHNDLEAVGKDHYHHTFFEMLGSWSFGDYDKKKACEMAWELLTKVYNLKAENLYVTYFGGDEKSLPPDEECKNIWLEIGVEPSHIFPFGIKENFWEMGDKGPCGPCTEIHYDYLSNGALPAVQRINADRPDLIEVWNLVFIQYNRCHDGSLQKIPLLNVDTGMGLERLVAILQGVSSNYDTDLFTPLFQAIEKNFKVDPYENKAGAYDTDPLGVAYRILADHSRMFSVAIADGLFPDNSGAGSVLRKIIRKATYTANRVIKAPPGVLSSLVPYVADSLDFFPEIHSHVNEIINIVNEEEKLFHQAINRGRKARNKIINENNTKILNAQNVLQLHQVYGLEDNVIKDIASEIKLDVEWREYEKLKQEQKSASSSSGVNEKESSFHESAKTLLDKGARSTDDSFKYNFNIHSGVEKISADVIAILRDNQIIQEVAEGTSCVIVTNKTNFYSEAGGQIADLGEIRAEDFAFKVKDVQSCFGYVFHEGSVIKGNVKTGSPVEMIVENNHRIACSQNHTAAHLLNAALRKTLTYTVQRTSYVGSSNLRLGFSSKAALTSNQLTDIEDFVNSVIHQKLNVDRSIMSYEEMLYKPNVVILHGEEYPATVSVITISAEDDENNVISVEPCCGTHVRNTQDISEFILLPQKSHGGSTRVLNAVTGKQAAVARQRGKALEENVNKLKGKVENALSITNINTENLKELLKEVKKALKECQQQKDVPIKIIDRCEEIIQDLKLKINDVLNTLSEDLRSDHSSDLHKKDERKISANILNSLKSKSAPTDDKFKYMYDKENPSAVGPITASIVAVIKDDDFISTVKSGLQCQVVTDKTNFYAEGDDQAADKGVIYSKDFLLKVCDVYNIDGYIFHDGWIENGELKSLGEVCMVVDEKHRLACSQNHTALHLLNSTLNALLPYSFQQSAYVGPYLKLNFSSKVSLSEEQIDYIEKQINNYINGHLDVSRSTVSRSNLKHTPVYKAPMLKEFHENIPLITISNSEEMSNSISTEPCCGTHVRNTSDINQFIVTCYKTVKKNEKVLYAVTGERAEIVHRDGKLFDEQMSELEEQVYKSLSSPNPDFLELWDWLKEVKLSKALHNTELPFLVFRKHQHKLSELRERLTVATNDFIQNGFSMVKAELKSLLEESKDEPFIVYPLKSLGDGKKIVNFVLDAIEDKPVMVFAHDGHKSVICSCEVPKEYVSQSFSALLWMNPVATLLNGQSRTLSEDPELMYSVVSFNVDKVNEAIAVAKKYAASNLLLNNRLQSN